MELIATMKISQLTRSQKRVLSRNNQADRNETVESSMKTEIRSFDIEEFHSRLIEHLLLILCVILEGKLKVKSNENK